MLVMAIMNKGDKDAVLTVSYLTQQSAPSDFTIPPWHTLELPLEHPVAIYTEDNDD